MCDLENLVNEEAIARVGLQRHIKKVPTNTVRGGIGIYKIMIQAG
jgi:hypothetical protein